MEKAESQLLSEVGRLRRKANLLDDEIKRAQRTLVKVNEDISNKGEEIKKLDVELKFARKGLSSIKTDLENERKEIARERNDLEKESGYLKDRESQIDSRAAQATLKVKAAEAKIGTLKEQVQSMSRIKAEIEGTQRRVDAESVALEEKSKALKGETLKENAAFNERQISLSNREAAVKIEGDRQIEARKRAGEVTQKLTERSSALDKIGRDFKDYEKVIGGRESICSSKEIDIVVAEKSNAQMRAALEADRDVLEVERLRFQKLVKEKGVKKELDALRNGA